jgi:hypothetical protein
MLIRRGMRSMRRPGGWGTTLAIGVVVFGLAVAPFCRCLCGEHGTAAAETPPCHGHARHAQAPPRADHPCEHAGCAGLAAAIPQAQHAWVASTAPLVGTPLAAACDETVPIRTAIARPGVDRDVGPTVPTPLFSILRP